MTKRLSFHQRSSKKKRARAPKEQRSGSEANTTKEIVDTFSQQFWRVDQDVSFKKTVGSRDQDVSFKKTVGSRDHGRKSRRDFRSPLSEKITNVSWSSTPAQDPNDVDSFDFYDFNEIDENICLKLELSPIRASPSPCAPRQKSSTKQRKRPTFSPSESRTSRRNTSTKKPAKCRKLEKVSPTHQRTLSQPKRNKSSSKLEKSTPASNPRKRKTKDPSQMRGSGAKRTKDVLDSGSKDVLDSGAKDVLNSGAKDVLDSGAKDVLNSGAKDVLDSGAKDVLNSGAKDVLDSGAKRTKDLLDMFMSPSSELGSPSDGSNMIDFSVAPTSTPAPSVITSQKDNALTRSQPTRSSNREKKEVNYREMPQSPKLSPVLKVKTPGSVVRGDLLTSQSELYEDFPSAEIIPTETSYQTLDISKTYSNFGYGSSEKRKRTKKVNKKRQRLSVSRYDVIADQMNQEFSDLDNFQLSMD